MRCQYRTILSAAVIFSLYGCTKAPPAGNGVATVSWIAPTQNSDGSKITDLAGYYIYYGISPNTLNQSVQISDPRTTAYTVSNLRSGTTYYFSVVAITASGIRGGTSPTVSKTIP
jgi:Fibronectin type III domain